MASGGDPNGNAVPLRLASHGSLGTSMTGDRYSRRLYVITEESTSMIGGQTLDRSRAGGELTQEMLGVAKHDGTATFINL